uniref:Reverse transcriptase domain-containing protein n=1 Tax=Tanacetum cinerariifolium TaxID=118510 RepID=A0A699GWK3_TANCI|nr:reverse transcriptase domain-containing protein [Tanacetum cinerariifolium]
MPNKIKMYDGTTDPEDHLSRFAGAANSIEWSMPVWCRMFQQTLDGSARGWFQHLPHDSINEWAELREAFAARFSVRRACFKEPHEITKITRKANESLIAFKEKWTVETDKVPATVNGMMERLDDFVRSKESYPELPKGEIGESHRKMSLLFNGRDTREYNRRVTPVLTLNCLTKHPKEILAIKTQLRLPVPRPMLNPLRSGNADRYCDYHQKKGHYTNDCMQLRKQLEMDLESGKLKHLVKDVRQMGRGSHSRDDPQQTKIINVISINSVKDKKRKISETTESWMNVPISFPAISSEDVFEEPLIVEAEVEGYLVRRVYVDEGSLVEVMFEHCFENLNPRIKDRLRETQTDLVGFAGETVYAKSGEHSQRRSEVVANQVAEWAKAGIVRPVKYPTYISNPVLVKKGYGAWRMCIDFKNLNSACSKDYYPLPNIDCATYQRLVDSAFQSQIGRNLEAYVDDMVIKSRNEKMLLADIAKTFDNLKKINMKLNPKKCSFRVEERKFLGYVMKKLIMELPSLMPPREKETLYAYLVVPAEAVSAVLLTDRKGRQYPVQYVSRTLNEAEINYAPVEKLALSLIHMTQRLRRYLEAHPIKVITDQPIKNILSNTKTSGKLAKYAVELGAYNITFIPRNTLKGQVLAYFLSEAPEGTKEDLYFRMPEATMEKDEVESWTLFTDGASSPNGLGAGSASRIEDSSAVKPIKHRCEGRFQACGTDEASKDSMIKYLAKAREYVSGFKSFSIENIPKNMNQKADVLSKLASVAFNHLTKECLEEGTWLKDKNEARCLRAKIGQYTMEYGVPFKKWYLVPMLRYVGPLQANYVIREIHMGSCGMHIGPCAVVRKAIRQGYYWPTMHEDAKKEVEKCDPCQVHDSVPRLPKTLMTPIMAPWTFYQWGMGILGPLPPARGGAKFVIVSIDYFTKFRLPRVIVTDNGAQLQSNGETPFGLTYGNEAVIPAEIGITTYQTLMIREGYNEEEMRLNIDLLQEIREAAAIREAKYKTKMEQYYNRKVCTAGFRPGEFLFRRNEASRVEDQGKLGPK